MTVKQSCLTLATALLLSQLSVAYAAEEDTVQAVIPWEGQGEVHQVDTGTMMFLGSIEGVMYIESSSGDMNEAFVMCPMIQKLDIESGRTEAEAHCEITASPDDVAYAHLSCDGEIGNCRGSFTLIDGEGRFAGISGSGDLRVRSPMHALVSDLAAGATLRVSAGLAIVKDLGYRIQ